MEQKTLVDCCKNCGNTLLGNYCNDCGQKGSVDRIGFQYLSAQFTHDVLQFERGLLYTAGTLFYRPGQVIKDYISGKRVVYTKPFTYLIIISALYIFLSLTFGFATVIQDLINGVEHGLTNDGNKSSSVMLDVLYWLNGHYVASVLLSVPLFAFATRVAFYKFNFNIYEHFVINLYISCQRMIIYAVLGPISLLWKGFEPFPLLFSLIYTVFAYFQVFDSRSITKKAILVIVSYMIFLLLTVALLIIGAIIHEVFGYQV